VDRQPVSLEIEQGGAPVSPVFSGGVLLTPQRFLKDIPRVTPDGFWSWAEQNENETLRFDLNYDLAESLSRREKARLDGSWLGGRSTCSSATSMRRPATSVLTTLMKTPRA
jgi:hypothetical protein